MNTAQSVRRFCIGLALILLIAGCTRSHNRERSGAYIDDPVITSEVEATIFNDSMLKQYRIDVETFNGVVLLSGFVGSAQASSRAVKITKAVDGVKAVKNSIVVK